LDISRLAINNYLELALYRQSGERLLIPFTSYIPTNIDSLFRSFRLETPTNIMKRALFLEMLEDITFFLPYLSNTSYYLRILVRKRRENKYKLLPKTYNFSK